MFDARTGRFTLYADDRLRTPDVLPRVLRAFGLDPARCDVRSDPHCRPARDL